MCSDLWDRLTTTPGTASKKAEADRAADAAASAARAQKKAIQDAQTAAATAAGGETEDSKKAAEARLRRLLSAGGFGATLSQPASNAAMIGTKVLLGA